MFKFDKYPNLLKLHLIYNDLVMESYKLEVAREKQDSNELKNKQKLQDQIIEDFKIVTYAKEIFDILKNKNLKLYNIYEEKEYSWDEIYEDNFAKLNENQKIALVLMIEDARPFRLPKEYYDNI